MPEPPRPSNAELSARSREIIIAQRAEHVRLLLAKADHHRARGETDFEQAYRRTAEKMANRPYPWDPNWTYPWDPDSRQDL